MRAPTPGLMRVGFFTEVYHPVVNGVVASVDALAAGLRALGHDVYCFAPSMPGYDEGEAEVYRMPSLPLPMGAPYRLTVPMIGRRRRHAIVNRLDVLHAHSPFVTGWMSVRFARRLRIPLIYTYHTRLEEYAHYVPFDETATRRAATTLTRNFANLADAVVVPTPAMRDRSLALRQRAAQRCRARVVRDRQRRRAAAERFAAGPREERRSADRRARAVRRSNEAGDCGRRPRTRRAAGTREGGGPERPRGVRRTSPSRGSAGSVRRV